MKLYEEGKDDTPDEKDGPTLPAVNAGDALNIEKIAPEQHFTEPPPRYSEATLVNAWKSWALGDLDLCQRSVCLRERDYVVMDRNRFIPQDKGRLVVAFLENFFERYVEYDFTAGLEADLTRFQMAA